MATSGRLEGGMKTNLGGEGELAHLKNIYPSDNFFTNNNDSSSAVLKHIIIKDFNHISTEKFS